jgi:hypothetical protein
MPTLSPDDGSNVVHDAEQFSCIIPHMNKRVLLTLGIVIILAAMLLTVALYQGWLSRFGLCPSGHKQRVLMSGTSCAPHSGKSCTSDNDCPKNESCGSRDGQTWICSGAWDGCYYGDPENLSSPMICID